MLKVTADEARTAFQTNQKYYKDLAIQSNKLDEAIRLAMKNTPSTNFEVNPMFVDPLKEMLDKNGFTATVKKNTENISTIEIRWDYYPEED